jgi:ribosome-associated protein
MTTIKVHLNTTPTELYKILKFEGLVSNGAEAKQVISEGLVSVNQQIETKKRKKIVPGDSIEFANHILLIS